MAATSGAILALVLAWVALAPVDAPAQEFHDRTGRGPGGSVNHPFVPAPPMIQPRIPGFAPAPPMAQPNVQGFPVPSHRPPSERERHDRGRFAAPTVIYAVPPVIYYGAPTSGSSDASAEVYAPPPAYDPPVAYGAPVTPDVEPMPSVIEYSTGRYELRGDGISTPHTWVWIPNPPPAPPVAPPAAPAVSPPPAPTASTPARRTTIYRWTDEQGVVHFTDSSEAVPLEYRAQAKQPPS
jgi:uncharacterized protein DUF4124